MAAEDYLPDTFDESEDDEPENKTCNRCGATGLDWIHTGVRWALQEPDGSLHVCKQIDAAGDFDAL